MRCDAYTVGCDAYTVALSALLAAAATVSAASCPATGGDPPSVLTLIATKDKTDEAVIVDTSCRIVETLTEVRYLKLSQGIERIESVPSATSSIELVGVPLSEGADFSNANKLEIIWMRNSSIDLGRTTFPNSLLEILAFGQPQHPEMLSLPVNLNSLTIGDAISSSLKSLKLPSGLTSFSYINGKITTIDFPLPSSLTALRLYDNAITTVQGVTFPDKLSTISLKNNKLTAIRGAQWPKDLTSLELDGQTIAEFEIRESDWQTFSKLGTLPGNFSQTSCRVTEAKQRPVQNAMVCVITDEKFNELYKSSSSSSSSSSNTSEDTDNGGGAGASSRPSNWMGSNSGASSNPFNPNSNGGNPSNTTQDGGGTNATYVAIIVSAGIVIALLLAVLGYRGFLARKRNQRPEDGTVDLSKTYNSASTPGVSSANADASSSSTAIPNDIREDLSLVKFRIDQTELLIQGIVARGGHGIISMATWHGRTVAVKQMLPDSWHRDAVLPSFMDEIRMCAQLDHPRVVAFVGIAWTSLRDLSVVTEFMAGGDLHALLTKQPTPTRPQDWTRPWTSAQIKSKTSIALDIAEAVVYLHSFPLPILHRDLKARNVLLDTEGNAKLSDFGISRVMAVDETMTSEVGTVAWIAPEVLRGERYSDSADMYSFGVVLVELDLCQHPYVNHMKRPLNESSSLDMHRGSQAMGTLKNTQIAVSVSTGSLRPVPSRGCPSSIASLVSKCVAFDPAMRPTAMQIAYELRQLRREREETEHFF